MNIRNGLTAGFVATVVVSLLIMAKHSLGIVPQLDPVGMVAALFGRLTGTPPDLLVGWLLHFVIGTGLWGVGYAVLADALIGPPAVRGVTFGVGAWLLMMLIVMPLAGAGVFGLALGIEAATLMLVMHLVFGGTLGIVYASSQGEAARADVMPG